MRRHNSFNCTKPSKSDRLCPSRILAPPRLDHGYGSRYGDRNEKSVPVLVSGLDDRFVPRCSLHGCDS